MIFSWWEVSLCFVSHCSVPCLPFFIYQPVQSSEHMAAFGVFGLCQIHAFVDYLRSKLNAQQFEVLFKSVISLVGFILLSVGAVLMLTGKRINNNSNEWENLCKSFWRDMISTFLSGKISPWTGRFYSLLDPSYAKNNIPIIASVSEHQPTTWSSYYFDLQLLVFMFPGKSAKAQRSTGLIFCNHSIFHSSLPFSSYSRSVLLF